MPLYEYKCKECGHRFERIQSFSAPDVKECPVCGKEVERLISAPAVQFKGSGFYSTDYAPKPATGNASATGEAGNGAGKSEVAGKSDAAKTDGNQAAKTESKSESAAAPAPAAKSE